MMDDNKDADAAIRLMLGYLCIAKESEASLSRKVQILDRFNFRDAEIAIICDSAVQAVRNARHMLKKKPYGKKKK
ncbi:MAG: hypothetical protein EPO61_10035 [Nitrospirae bacterium]|nr:MAG: hypothetical protein EPO61_10035 [Nitrospirota bacterium]